MKPKIPGFAAFAQKLATRNSGAYFLLATPGSISIIGLLNLVLEQTPVKALVLPLLVAAVCLFVYFITFVLDIISGLKASRCESVAGVDYFSSAKGWNSIWKISVVFILVVASCFFSMLAAIAGVNFLANFFLFSAGIVAIMATLLDVYSIGENQKRISGSKSRIFDWLDQITKLLNQGIHQKLKSIFRI
ncbi:phage holin family protein [Salegentibacter sp. HM20]